MSGNMSNSGRARPVDAILARAAYVVERPRGPIDLRLDGNEGPAPPDAVVAAAQLNPELLRRYPDTLPLQQLLAARIGARPEQVLVTAGADDGLDRACRALLSPGRELILPAPTFEMIARYAELTGATLRSVPWPDGRYPLDAVLGCVSEHTVAIAAVSPNNPTGAVIDAEQLTELSRRAPHAIIWLDHAYVEMADHDLTELALTLPNVLVFRTLSKAWGLAGLRVGYVLGPAEVIDWLRRSGHPYPVSSASLALAAAALTQADGSAGGLGGYRERVRSERAALLDVLQAPGIEALASQANFVFVRGPRAPWLRAALGSLGISVRGWGPGSDCEGAVRISCPGNEQDFARLCSAILTVLQPEALLFDMDGVMVDVRASYRTAILQTAASYGVALSLDDIAKEKARAGSNNDWQLSLRLLTARGVDCTLEEVTRRFEAAYQGDGDTPGLHLRETPLFAAESLRQLAARLPLAVVTGRPRADAERYLAREGIADCFAALICMEDAPLKPDPAPVRLAMQRLGVERAWMLGDTPDDIRAAAGAGVVSIGVCDTADGEQERALYEAGAAKVMRAAHEVKELLS